MTGARGSAMSPWIRERLAGMLESDDALLRSLRFFFGEAEKLAARGKPARWCGGFWQSSDRRSEA